MSFILFRCLLCDSSPNFRALFCERCLEQVLSACVKKQSYLFYYESLLPKVLSDLRRSQNMRCIAYFIELALQNSLLKDCCKSSDLIVCVPSVYDWWKPRKLNLIDTFALQLASIVGLEFYYSALKKTHRHRQHTLSWQERINCDLFLALNCNLKKIQNKRILLLDDVQTSGTSLEQASFILRSAGASAVHSFTLCRTRLDRRLEPGNLDK